MEEARQILAASSRVAGVEEEACSWLLGEGGGEGDLFDQEAGEAPSQEVEAEGEGRHLRLCWVLILLV